METVAESRDQALAEDLVYFFVGRNEKECFAACLYTCYDLIRPDVVLEVAWRCGLTDFAMPFMIQSFRQFNDKLTALSSKFEEAEKARVEEEAKAKKAMEEKQHTEATHMPFNVVMPLGLPAPSGYIPTGNVGGMGMGGGGMGGGTGGTGFF